MGLAMYNGILLGLPLPLATYKKLLDLQPDIEDLKEILPQQTESLKNILKDDNPNLQEDLYMTFTV